MCYDDGWPSVIQNVSIKETHGTFYTDAKPVHLFSLKDYHVKNKISLNNLLSIIILRKYDHIFNENQ